MFVGGICIIVIGESLRRSLLIISMNMLLNKMIAQLKINGSIYEKNYSVQDKQSLEEIRGSDVFYFEDKFYNVYNDKNKFLNTLSLHQVNEIPSYEQRSITMGELAYNNSVLPFIENDTEIAKALSFMYRTGRQVCIVKKSKNSDYIEGVITLDKITYHLLKKIFT
jgi:hypothetical protein